MNKIIKISFILSLMATILIGCNNSTSDKRELTISAAASLNETLNEITGEFLKDNPNINIVCNYGSSGSLQKQIEQGAPCDLFLSASEKNVSELIDENLIVNDTNKTFVKNSLVLVAPKDSTITSINDLKTNKVNHIAIGEISSVPAGMYANEALENLNLKESLNNKLVYAKDVKEVLAWVASGNADVGFIYKSDAVSSKEVKIISEIPDNSHTPINYVAGVIKNSTNEDIAKEFEDYLFSNKAKTIFEKYGYIVQ